MIEVGVIEDLFRYPVKSMQGEKLSTIDVDSNGLKLDRTWAIIDVEKKEITGAKKIPELLQYKARYINDENSERSPEVEIECPDGKIIQSSASDVSKVLSDLIGKPLALDNLKPSSDLKHYKLKKKLDKKGTRDLLGLAPDEPIPDFSEMPLSMLMKLQMFATPPGTYFDAYPIHILSSGALEHMQQISGNENFCVERFRPNIFINTGNTNSFTDFDWCHHQLKIGTAVFKIDGKTPRCSMPGRAQGEIPEDKDIPRQMYEYSERNLGVYANVLKSGVIEKGDKVYLMEDKTSPLLKSVKKGIRGFKKSAIKLAT